MNCIALYLKEGTLLAHSYGEIERQCALPFGEGDPEALAAALLEALGELPCDAALCPGGAVKPLSRGIYPIDGNVLRDLDGRHGEHPYNALTRLCSALAARYGAQPLMVNPLSCDELLPLNRVTSLNGVEKRSRYFACEHAALLEAVAWEKKNRPEENNVIALWLDDMVSVGAHMKGVCIEVNDAIGGEGPMGFTSSGDLPVAQLAERFFSEGGNAVQWERKLNRESGVLAYTGSSDPAELDRRAGEKDENVRLALEAMAYQTAKWVGICTLALQGQVDAIAIGGKGASCKTLMEALSPRLQGIAPLIAVEELDMLDYLARAAQASLTPAAAPWQYGREDENGL